MSEESTDRRLIVREGAAHGYWFLNQYVEMLATGEDTDGRYTFFEVHAPPEPPGMVPPMHVHREADESFFVLKGELKVWIGTTSMTLGPGDFALLPKQVPHTFVVASREPAHFLVNITPAGFDEFLIAISRPAPEARIPEPLPPPSPADLERFSTLLVDITDVELLGPPSA